MPVADAEFNSAAWEKSGKRYNQLASGSVPRARVAASAETIEARKMMGRIASADEKTRKQIEELLAKAAVEAETKNHPFYSKYIYS
jgi:hypothetical protein